MDLLRHIAMQQVLVWAVFSILVVVGALAQRRWGIVASVVMLALGWPIFLGAALLNELRDIPQLLELNPLGLVVRMLWQDVTLDTVALAVALWFVRRATSVRGAIVRGVGSAAVWAFVMPVPLMFIGIALMSVIPAGKAEFYYVDFRPMGLDVLENAKPPFRHYTGDAIPLRYRTELDGREIEVKINAVESTLVLLEIHAPTPGSPQFAIDSVSPAKCADGRVSERANVIFAEWSQPTDRVGDGGRCYGVAPPEAELTFHFVGGETTLTLRGPIMKGGEYYYYDSL